MFYKPYLAQQWIVHEWLFNHRRHLKQSCAYTMTTHHFNVSVANISYYIQSVLYKICIKLQCYSYTRTQPFIISMLLVQIRLHVYYQHGWVSLRFNAKLQQPLHQSMGFCNPSDISQSMQKSQKGRHFFQHCSTNNANAVKCIFRLLNLGHIFVKWHNTIFIFHHSFSSSLWKAILRSMQF